jgi:uncharacterized SAM-dependent methyltransferase
MFIDVAIHDSCDPRRREADLRAALAQRRLPGRLLYAGPAQAERWLAYHRAWAPSRRDAALRAAYRGAFAAALAGLPAGPFHLVGLGCGDGSKEAELLEAAAEAGAGAERYTPLDGSLELLLEAAQAARAGRADLPVHPLAMDLAALADLPPWLAQREPRPQPRLFTAFGILPNAQPEALAAALAGLLRPGDTLLLSANLSPGGYAADRERILAQYDNPQARHWYGGALEALGLLPGDFALEVRAVPLAADGARWQVRVSARLLRPVRLGAGALELGAGAVPLAQGERLEVFFSNRFTQGAVEDWLGAAGLGPARVWPHDAGEEAVFLCRRAAGAGPGAGYPPAR